MSGEVKAFVLQSLDAPPELHDLPAPAPAESEVLVRVRASAANPADNAIASGMVAGMFEHEFPVVLGRDYAGVVEQVGAGVTRFTPGDEVFGFVPMTDPTVHNGSWAQLIAVPEDRLARTPGNMDVATAGAAALAGISAMLSIDALAPSEGDRLLIIGANGGVGSIAVQLAARAAATVIAPALPDDEDYLRGLGVAEMIERSSDVAAAVREVDGVLDLVSYSSDEFEANAAALSNGGRAASTIGAAGDAPGRTNIMAVGTPANLERLAGLLDSGVNVPIHATYELDRAGEALEALATTHVQGKIAIRVG